MPGMTEFQLKNDNGLFESTEIRPPPYFIYIYIFAISITLSQFYFAGTPEPSRPLPELEARLYARLSSMSLAHHVAHRGPHHEPRHRHPGVSFPTVTRSWHCTEHQADHPEVFHQAAKSLQVNQTTSVSKERVRIQCYWSQGVPASRLRQPDRRPGCQNKVADEQTQTSEEQR